jgi:hypothetical protein
MDTNTNTNTAPATVDADLSKPHMDSAGVMLGDISRQARAYVAADGKAETAWIAYAVAVRTAVDKGMTYAAIVAHVRSTVITKDTTGRAGTLLRVANTAAVASLVMSADVFDSEAWREDTTHTPTDVVYKAIDRARRRSSVAIVRDVIAGAMDDADDVADILAAVDGIPAKAAKGAPRGKGATVTDAGPATPTPVAFMASPAKPDAIRDAIRLLSHAFAHGLLDADQRGTILAELVAISNTRADVEAETLGAAV